MGKAKRRLCPSGCAAQSSEFGPASTNTYDCEIPSDVSDPFETNGVRTLYHCRACSSLWFQSSNGDPFWFIGWDRSDRGEGFAPADDEARRNWGRRK